MSRDKTSSFLFHRNSTPTRPEELYCGNDSHAYVSSKWKYVTTITSSADSSRNCAFKDITCDAGVGEATKEHFDQILDDITRYERYCADHPEYENNKAVFAIANIKRVYQKCADENIFL